MRRVLEQFIRLVKTKVAQGDVVHLRTFGRFAPKRRARKVARNLNENTALVIEAHHIPSFKPSDSFAEEVKKLTLDSTS